MVIQTALTDSIIESAKPEHTVTYIAASIGHCKTAFNGFRGSKDPLDGARVIAKLALAQERKYDIGLEWLEGDEKEASRVPG